MLNYNEKDAQTVVTRKSSETLHNDHEILIFVQNTNNSEFGCYFDFQQYRTWLYSFLSLLKNVKIKVTRF